MPLTPPVLITGVPTNIYFTWQNFVNRYGLRNVTVASNKDSTQNTGTTTIPVPSGTPNYYFVQDSFNVSTDQFHRHLKGGVLAVPLIFTGGVVPTDIGRLVMHLAWMDIYGSRGLEENSKKQATQKYVMQLAETMDTIAAMRSGNLQVPEATQATDAAMTPILLSDIKALQGNTRGLGAPWNFKLWY